MARLLVDGREFVPGRRTGIGRFLEGLLLAICHRYPEWPITVGMQEPEALPLTLQGRVTVRLLPRLPELAWPRWSREHDLFISPYPKLPLLHLACPAVHTVHDVLYLTHSAYRASGIKSHFDLWVLKRALKRAALSWFDSAASRDECERLTGMGQEGVVRHLPVSELFVPAGDEGYDDYFLFVGNGLPHKNLDIALQALQQVEGRLVCVGVRGEAADALMQRYPALHERVEFAGQVDDAGLLHLYRRATALLQPSTAEGYGYPPLEAMACGTPAICSDIAVLVETSGGCGLYCDPHDVTAWQHAMTRMREPALRARLRREGLAWIAARQGDAGWQGQLNDLVRLAGGA
jgi:glycosyltransferase involved in cell wall biosynthesis